jgi:hypothetical protein
MSILKTGVTLISSLGIVAGMAGGIASAQTPSTITNTGPESHNIVVSNGSDKTKVENNNDLNYDSSNPQTAETGSAWSSDNTTGGGATSGPATNTSSTMADVVVTNDSSSAMPATDPGSGSDGAGTTISDTGPESTNKVIDNDTTTTTVTNNNDLSVDTNNTQKAKTGDASVSDNTTGGSATSGAATNVSNNSVSFDVSNE